MDFEIIAYPQSLWNTYTVKFLDGEFADLTLSWFGFNGLDKEIAPSGKLRDYWDSFYSSLDNEYSDQWIVKRRPVISPPAPVVFKGHYNTRVIIRQFIEFIEAHNAIKDEAPAASLPAITQRYVMMGRDSFDAVALNENPHADLPRWRLGGPEAWVEYTYTNNFLTGARVLPPEEVAARFPHPFAVITGNAKPAGDRAAHEAHCFQGEYAAGCKYGDGYDCPAAPSNDPFNYPEEPAPNPHDVRPEKCNARLRQMGVTPTGRCATPYCLGGPNKCIGETDEQRRERISYELESCGCGHPYYEQGEHSPECSYHG